MKNLTKKNKSEKKKEAKYGLKLNDLNHVVLGKQKGVRKKWNHFH